LVTVLRQLALADPVTGELLRAALDSAGEAAPFSARSTSPQAGGGWPGPSEPSEPSEPEQQCQDLGDLAERALAAGDRDTAAASYLALVGLRERLVAVTPGRAQV
jgi:tetratricopeptide (TPR) repeat protein